MREGGDREGARDNGVNGIEKGDEKARGKGARALSEHANVGQGPGQDALENDTEHHLGRRRVGRARQVRVELPVWVPVQLLERLRQERLGRRDVAVRARVRGEEGREGRVAREDLFGEAVALVEEQDKGRLAEPSALCDRLPQLRTRRRVRRGPGIEKEGQESGRTCMLSSSRLMRSSSYSIWSYSLMATTNLQTTRGRREHTPRSQGG